MRRIAWTVALGGAMLVVGTGFHAQQEAQEKPLDPALIERGKEVYAELKCAVCHSIEGVGNKRGPLDEAGEKYAREELRLWMLEPRTMEDKTGATRRPRMPAYPKLSTEDLDAVVEYMASLRKDE